MQRAWSFQVATQKARLGDKCPWSVGWYDPQGRRRQKSIGSKSQAEKYCRRVEGELAAGVYGDRKRVKWADFKKQYIDVVMAGKAEGTVRIYQDALDTFERIARPGYMDMVNTAMVDSFTAKRRNEPACTPVRSKGPKPDSKVAEKKPRKVAAGTVNKELRHVRAALRKAWRWGMLAQPPQVAMLRESQRDPYFIDDAAFAKLYGACDKMTFPANARYTAEDWWKALLCFAYLTGWRIGEILELRRDNLDLEAGIAKVDADSTKGRKDARVELHPVVIEHLKAILDFQPAVFTWPHHPRTLWEEFTKLKTAAGLTFPGAFHRFRFGFANANVDKVDADLLQKLMRHQSQQTTRGYINMAERLKRSGVADRLHVPAFLQTATG